MPDIPKRHATTLKANKPYATATGSMASKVERQDLPYAEQYFLDDLMEQSLEEEERPNSIASRGL